MSLLARNRELAQKPVPLAASHLKKKKWIGNGLHKFTIAVKSAKHSVNALLSSNFETEFEYICCNSRVRLGSTGNGSVPHTAVLQSELWYMN